MLHTLNSIFPIRYTVFGLSALGLLLSLFTLAGFGVGLPALLLFLALVGLGTYDVRQTRRSILRNYPIIGHLRFMLEFVRPEIASISSRATAKRRRSRAPRASRTNNRLARSWRCTRRVTSG